MNMDQICAELAAEHADLDAVLSTLSEEQWRQQTPAEGWDVAETVIHLGQADYAGRLAASDSDAFAAFKEQLTSGAADLARGSGHDVDSMSGTELLEWWRSERSQMLEAFAAHEPKDRLPWFGPDMGAQMFATARLMETWSHGQDIADTVGAVIAPTDRLRNVAHIGVATRGWSYMNRGMEVPEGTVRVELTAPSGELWTWGPEDADGSVKGTALEFCLLTTQRRPPESADLEVSGKIAEDWVLKAQAFAGPPTDTDASRAEIS